MESFHQLTSDELQSTEEELLATEDEDFFDEEEPNFSSGDSGILRSEWQEKSEKTQSISARGRA